MLDQRRQHLIPRFHAATESIAPPGWAPDTMTDINDDEPQEFVEKFDSALPPLKEFAGDKARLKLRVRRTLFWR